MAEILLQIGTVILHTLILYVFLVLMLSLIGHRQSAELSITELVVIMVIGSSVETAMVAGDTSLVAGLASASTLLVSNRILSWLMQRIPWLRAVLVGRPVLLVNNGRVLPRRLREAGLSEDDVLEGIRERGYDGLAQVRMAVLEMDGTISVVPKEDGR